MEVAYMTDDIVTKVKNALVEASTTFREDKLMAYERAILAETNDNSKWVMEQIVENSRVARDKRIPMCDDTGIPHILLEVGPQKALTGNILEEIKKGVAEGLKVLPGRPMAIMGNEAERISQSGGLSPESEAVEMAPIQIRYTKDNVLRLHIMMFGGGPAIRAKTYRVFHKHDTRTVIDEIVSWAKEGVGLLGCTPATLAVGIGRSHFEAAALMEQSLVDGNYNVQSDIEQEITRAVNEAAIGPLGLGGKNSVLATFVKVGPQRASGVRIVCVRPCCCFEPRIATVEL